MNVLSDLYRQQVNVDAHNLILNQEQVQQGNKELKTQQREFPNINTIFKLYDQLFKVIYINYGKKRISAMWFDDKSQPFSKLPEIGSTCSIYGKIYKVTFNNKSKKRITIEPI